MTSTILVEIDSITIVYTIIMVKCPVYYNFHESILNSSSLTKKWLDRLGYSKSGQGLHFSKNPSVNTHPYGTEINELLDPDGAIKAKVVYDVEGMPSICFIESSDIEENNVRIKHIREKIWNQNLISIFLIIDDEKATCYPVNNIETNKKSISFSNASTTSNYSRRDIDSGDVFERNPEWFSSEDKVDRQLLKNLQQVIQRLQVFNIKKNDAQYLMAQVLFVSYLEHRGIIGNTYREKHKLDTLSWLVSKKDKSGIVTLFDRLKKDLNGDFLEPESHGSNLWSFLSDEALLLVDDFLSRVDIKSNQLSIWNYDFRYIPVELISGIYESFLSNEQQAFGAYYTPRNLANFVIDQAFSTSIDVLKEKIYDGACGSGILLTTAYRRMLSYAQHKKGRMLDFKERSTLLQNNIFGSDISKAACRVTSFSLYLSLLEGLTPMDIAELQENEKVKLPTLSGNNILGGVTKGDFFSLENKHSNKRKFSLFLSNPPWVEPSGGSVNPSDTWAKENNLKIPRRQLAGAFMMRAKDCLIKGGRFCFILPVSIIAAPTSATFLKQWLLQNQLDTLINFGDLRKILFRTAKQPCIVAVGSPRENNELTTISFKENIDYFVPKADVSFALGRLTLHSSDRHIVNTRVACFNNEIFTTLYWGNIKDLSKITEYKLNGKLGDYLGSGCRWVARKGFHKKDASVKNPVSSKPLQSMKYLDAKQFSGQHPTLDKSCLTKFPDEIKTVTKLPDSLMHIFNSPKIVFTDGINLNRSVRASFSDQAFSFSSSIGVISGELDQQEVLKFVSVYLQSRFVQYMLLLTAYQVNFERERITLNNIKNLPFIHPDDHDDTEKAWGIIKKVNKKVKHENKTSHRLINNEFISSEYDDDIFDYFGIDLSMRSRVIEVATKITQNMQPTSIHELYSSFLSTPNNKALNLYAKTLCLELNTWRDLRGGTGNFEINISTNTKNIRGGLGIISIEPAAQNNITTSSSDKLVDLLIEKLYLENILPMEIHNSLQFVADLVLKIDQKIIIIKPMVSRFWLQGEAFQDSERIIQSLHKKQETSL